VWMDAMIVMPLSPCWLHLCHTVATHDMVGYGSELKKKGEQSYKV
jgi:hypothetical protein